MRAEEEEWRVLLEVLDEGLWCWMEVILEEVIERSEAWVVPGRVTLRRRSSFTRR